MFVHLLAAFWELALGPLKRFLGGPGARTRAESLNTGIDGGADPLPNVRPESAIFDTDPAPKFTSKSFDAPGVRTNPLSLALSRTTSGGTLYAQAGALTARRRSTTKRRRGKRQH